MEFEQKKSTFEILKLRKIRSNTWSSTQVKRRKKLNNVRLSKLSSLNAALLKKKIIAILESWFDIRTNLLTHMLFLLFKIFVYS